MSRTQIAEWTLGTPMTAGQMWLYAAQWGSYMTGGDPGACMYGFNEHGRVQDEAHRTACLDWIDNKCMPYVEAKPEDYDSNEKEKLTELRRYIADYPILDEFEDAYARAALFTTRNDAWDRADESGEEVPEGVSEYLDGSHSLSDFAPETLARIKADCARFRELAGDDLSHQSDDQNGYDFWMDRSGSGCGFRDRDTPREVAERLSALCDTKEFGELDLYVGDDGRLYF